MSVGIYLRSWETLSIPSPPTGLSATRRDEVNYIIYKVVYTPYILYISIDILPRCSSWMGCSTTASTIFLIPDPDKLVLTTDSILSSLKSFNTSASSPPALSPMSVPTTKRDELYSSGTPFNLYIGVLFITEVYFLDEIVSSQCFPNNLCSLYSKFIIT